MIRFPSILKTDNKMWGCDRNNREKQMTAAETNNLNLDEDATRDRETVRKRERAIKRGAYGCQVDQNKHWVLCCQRARFSQTDTKLDSPLYSSKQQNTDTTSSVNPCLCFFEENNFFFPFLSGLRFQPPHFFCDLLLPLSFICSLLSTPSFPLPCFYPVLSLSAPSLSPSIQTSLSLIAVPSSPHLSHS